MNGGGNGGGTTNDPFKSMHNCFSNRNNYASFSSGVAASAPLNVDTLSQVSGERSRESLDIEEIEDN